MVNMVNTAVNNNIYAGRKPGSKYNQSHTFQQKEVLEVPDGAAVNKYANVQEIYEALKYNASYRVDKQEQDEIAEKEIQNEESKKFKGVGVEFDVMFGNGNNCVCK